MKYIKSYYDCNDYKEILNYFFKIFVNENFLNIDKKDYHNIFKKSYDKILNDLINNNIKSDKKLFFNLRNELLYLIENNKILNTEINKHKIYLFSFKSDLYLDYNNILNHDFFRLKINPKYL